MPFFSIITPTFNRGYILPRAIKSVLNQTFKDWELIIVDDGSTDNTSEIVKEFLRDKRIKYIKLERNQGVGKARNKGIELSTGKFIIPLDSDNVLLENALEEIYKEILKYSATENKKSSQEENISLFFFQIRSVSGRKLAENFKGFINWKEYLCEKIRGEYLPVCQRDLLIEIPYETQINGGEGITWKKILKKIGKSYFSEKEVLLYDDTLSDRLSFKQRNFERLYKVFRQDLKIFWRDYLKFCPKLLFIKILKTIVYYILTILSKMGRINPR